MKNYPSDGIEDSYLKIQDYCNVNPCRKSSYSEDPKTIFKKNIKKSHLKSHRN